MTATASTPVLAGPPLPPFAHDNLCAAFQHSVAGHPDRVAVRALGGAGITWAEYGALARGGAARLAALGVGRGDAVVFLLANRPEHAWMDAAAMHLGAVGVSLYLATTPATQAYVVQDTGARVLVTERALAERAASLGRDCPGLEHVLCVDGPAPGAVDLAGVEPAPGFDFAACWRAIRPEDRATMMYTSGTTGAPKGTVYTHGNISTGLASINAGCPPPAPPSFVAFVPFAHAGQRAMVHYRAMTCAGTVTCCDPATLPAALTDAHPTSLFAPPAIWQALETATRAAVAADPDAARRAATEAALARSGERVRARRAGAALPPAAPGDDELLTAARARTGLDRLAEPILSAAPPAPALLEALHALGLGLVEVYALTEIPPITRTRPDPIDIGTVGRPLPGVAVRLGDDGEVLVRHAGVSSGYHDRPAQTAALLGEDGWAHTGDLGSLDGDGRLRLDGRRDERLATSLGHNVDPPRLEAALRAQTPLIAQACVVGAGRPYLAALITLAPGVAAGEPATRAAVAGAVARANAELAEPAQIRRWEILADAWAPGGDELTPTLKLRRRAVHARYAAEIAALYDE